VAGTKTRRVKLVGEGTRDLLFRRKGSLFLGKFHKMERTPAVGEKYRLKKGKTGRRKKGVLPYNIPKGRIQKH